MPVKWRKLSARWSQEREIAFLEHLALSSNVAASERVARLTPGTAYRQRLRDAGFARAWDVALREGYGRLEAATGRDLAIRAMTDPRLRDFAGLVR